jgi:hypothetical protein
MNQRSNVPEPHWHEENPWKDMLIYVPIEELAQCSMMIGQTVLVNNEPVIFNIGDVLRNWKQAGDKLDAYILTGKLAQSGGVRYGPELDQYLSPSLSTAKLRELARKYQR